MVSKNGQVVVVSGGKFHLKSTENENNENEMKNVNHCNQNDQISQL